MPYPGSTTTLLQGASIPQLRQFSAGNVFYVDTNGSNANNGLTWATPFLTIDYAIGRCTAANSDVIYVGPGHVTTITAAAGVAADVSGISIIGIGNDQNRPRINYTTDAAASLDVSAANITLENFWITMIGVDAITAGINVTAAGFTLRNCEVQHADATNQAVLCILTTAAGSRMTVENCYFHGTTDAGTATAIRLVGGANHMIRNNVFYGAYTTTLGAIQNVTTATTNCSVLGNVIDNRTAASTVCMTFVATTSTGVIANNRMQVLAGTAPIVGTGMSWSGGNYYAATIATGGTLI